MCVLIGNPLPNRTRLACHAKIGPSQNWSPQTDFGKKIAKSGPPEPILAAKIGPPGPILAAKIGPLGPILAAKIGPPCQK